MTKEDAIAYAIKQIPQILPLEEDDVITLVTQILDTSSGPEAIAEGFMNILGQDDMTFEFIFHFNELLEREPTKIESKNDVIKQPKQNDNEGMAKEPILQKLIPEPKPEIKPIRTKTKEVSNPPTKPIKNHKKLTGKQKKLKSLEEINEAVNFLSATHSESDSARYRCSCQGKRHPIFSIAPNCLSCGKIICIREGLNLNNCTFCGAELIPVNERVQLLEALKEEQEEITDNNEQQKGREVKRKPAKTYKIASGMGKNLFQEQDKLFDFIERQAEREKKRKEVLRERDTEELLKEQENKVTDEGVNEDLRNAQERLETLLHFQNTSAERTKIIDNASDFSMSSDSGLWGSARERALLLKKQQRNLRKWEKLEKERNGRKDKYVISMNIGPNGKVTMTESVKDHGNINANSDDDLENITDEEDAQDLKEIKSFKNDIADEKEKHNSELQANIWDYEKDKKKLERPIYVGLDSANTQNTKEETKIWKSRIQFNGDTKDALEDNILAVL